MRGVPSPERSRANERSESVTVKPEQVAEPALRFPPASSPLFYIQAHRSAVCENSHRAGEGECERTVIHALRSEQGHFDLGRAVQHARSEPRLLRSRHQCGDGVVVVALMKLYPIRRTLKIPRHDQNRYVRPTLANTIAFDGGDCFKNVPVMKPARFNATRKCSLIAQRISRLG